MEIVKEHSRNLLMFLIPTIIITIILFATLGASINLIVGFVVLMIWASFMYYFGVNRSLKNKEIVNHTFYSSNNNYIYICIRPGRFDGLDKLDINSRFRNINVNILLFFLFEDERSIELRRKNSFFLFLCSID